MPATTLAEMVTGRQVLRLGKDNILVIIKGIDSYLIRDLRPSSEQGAEAATFKGAWLTYDYDTARTTFNTDMADLS